MNTVGIMPGAGDGGVTRYRVGVAVVHAGLAVRIASGCSVVQQRCCSSGCCCGLLMPLELDRMAALRSGSTRDLSCELACLFTVTCRTHRSGRNYCGRGVAPLACGSAARHAPRRRMTDAHSPERIPHKPGLEPSRFPTCPATSTEFRIGAKNTARRESRVCEHCGRAE